MTLVDTSAWIEFMRRMGNPRVKDAVASCMRLRMAAVTGPVITELIAGSKNERERAFLAKIVGLCSEVAFLDDWWLIAGELKQTLIRKGVAIPIMDVLIAVAAKESGMPILSADRDFETLRRYALPELQVELIS